MSGILLATIGSTYSSAPVNLVLPSISGTAAAGQTLSSSTGTWSGQPTPTYAYQWQRSGSNISGATSSSYTVQFADVGTTLRCVVTATNSVGSTSATSASTSTISAPAIGTAIGGGYYGGQISTTANGVATHYLIVAPRSSGYTAVTFSSAEPYNSQYQSLSLIDGPGNTAAQLADTSETYYAASFCNNLTIGGYTDWYFPAIDEMQVLFVNLKPSSATNATNSGINDHSVPKRTTNYTSNSPSQTSVAIFQTGGTQAFDTGLNVGYTDYYSSTITGAFYPSVRGIIFAFAGGSGAAGSYDWTFNLNVRAVRRIPV